jgi:GTPase SAR1 family protein
MGCASSSQNVDEQLKAAELQSQQTLKLLVLGAGEAGKSTFVSMLRMIHGVEFTTTELEAYRNAIRKNALECMQAFIKAGRKFGYDEEGFTAEADAVMAVNARDCIIEPNIADAIEKLWTSNFILEAFERRKEFWHLDASKYYFDHIQEIVKDDYMQSETDRLMTRVLTTGILVSDLGVKKGYNLQVVDVGGQRSERRKWMHCFDNVSGILFFSNLNGYFQVCYEDGKTNRLKESMQLFETVAKNPLFTNIPIFLVLNKMDLFGENLKRYPLKETFEEFEGGDNVEEALSFLSNKFKSIQMQYTPLKPFVYFKSISCDKDATSALFQSVTKEAMSASKSK